MNRATLVRSERALRRAYRESGRPIWRALRELLGGAARGRLPEVNVGKINRLAEDSSIVVVPGKVLGAGKVDRKLVVGALAFSASARRKIEAAGGSAVSLWELAEKYRDAKGVKLIGG